MKVLGITGGIGSGKSVVVQILETMKIPVYQADIAAKEISHSSLVVRKKLSDRFGPGLYRTNVLDKVLLASLIFNQAKHLAFVCSVLHPEVLKHFLLWKEQHFKKSFIGVETAILFESDFEKQVDISINVFAPKALRIQRIQARDGWDRQTVFARMKNQLPDRERIKRADCTLINNCRRALLPQVERLLSHLQALR